MAMVRQLHLAVLAALFILMPGGVHAGEGCGQYAQNLPLVKSVEVRDGGPRLLIPTTAENDRFYYPKGPGYGHCSEDCFARVFRLSRLGDAATIKEVLEADDPGALEALYETRMRERFGDSVVGDKFGSASSFASPDIVIDHGEAVWIGGWLSTGDMDGFGYVARIDHVDPARDRIWHFMHEGVSRVVPFHSGMLISGYFGLHHPSRGMKKLWAVDEDSLDLYVAQGAEDGACGANVSDIVRHEDRTYVTTELGLSVAKEDGRWRHYRRTGASEQMHGEVSGPMVEVDCVEHVFQSALELPGAVQRWRFHGCDNVGSGKRPACAYLDTYRREQPEMWGELKASDAIPDRLSDCFD